MRLCRMGEVFFICGMLGIFAIPAVCQQTTNRRSAVRVQSMVYPAERSLETMVFGEADNSDFEILSARLVYTKAAFTGGSGRCGKTGHTVFGGQMDDGGPEQ